jgi:Thioredoxin-like proteins and domains
LEQLNEDNINAVLNKLRPYLQLDGGDVEFDSISSDNIVKLRLLGSCVDCPLNQMTLRAGIERALMMAFPQIKRVESVR